MTPAEAARAARRRLGNESLARETSRDVKLLPWLDSIVRDARYGSRMLCKSPMVTKTGEDFKDAAFIFQHADTSDDDLFAHVLAMEAVLKETSVPGSPFWIYSVGITQARSLRFRR